MSGRAVFLAGLGALAALAIVGVLTLRSRPEPVAVQPTPSATTAVATPDVPAIYRSGVDEGRDEGVQSGREAGEHDGFARGDAAGHRAGERDGYARGDAAGERERLRPRHRRRKPRR